MSQTAASPSPSSPSVPVRARALWPDVARGASLALIAAANAIAWQWHSPSGVLVKPTEPGPVDLVVDVLTALLADNRGLPLFALLFGYGIGILRRSPRRARKRVILRRHVVLALIGAAHGILLFPGDIILVYGVIGLLVALLAGSRAALIVATVIGILWMGLWGWIDGTYLSDEPDPVLTDPTVLGALAARAEEVWWSIVNLPFDLAVLAPMAIGVGMARARLLERTGENADARTLVFLRRSCVQMLAISLVGALPLTVVLVIDPAGASTSETLRGVFGVLHQLTGLAGAIGMAFAATVLGARFAGSRPVQWLAATGRMSMTGYVLQSLVAALLLPAWSLGLGAHLGTAAITGILLLAWLLGAVIAVQLGERRGPLEALLRRLSRP